MGVDKKTLEEIVRRILSVSIPDKIILFGSAATGQMTPDSDIDILIIEPQILDRKKEYVRVRRALRGVGYPFDLLFITTKWFEESKNVIGSIAYPANRFGKIIYEAA